MNDKQQRPRLLIDGATIRNEFFGCQPCINTFSSRLRTADLLTIFLPAIEYSYALVVLPVSGAYPFSRQPLRK